MFQFRSTRLLSSVFLASTFLFASLSVQADDSGKSLKCPFVGPIQGVYFNQHISHSSGRKRGWKKKVEERTVDQYVKKLDGSKLYLLDSDVKKLKGMLKGIVSSVEKRPEADCSALVKAQELFKKRVKERVDFANKYLGKKFKFNKKTKFVLDPEKRGYPKNKAAAETFQRKYIQFQISNFLATDMKLEEAKAKVRRRYERNFRRVAEMDETEVYSQYLDAFARSLDPHSSYFSADVMEDFRIQMSLSLEGIGATLSFKDGFTVIEQLIPGGAAARDGRLKPKDKIVAVGQGACAKDKSCPFENVVEVPLRDVVKQIRGKKGTQVRLKIHRHAAGKKEKFVITLVRDKVKLEDEAADLKLVEREREGKKFKVGLINLPSFYSDSKPGGRTSAKDVKKILKEARDKDVDSVVLDFSANGGGSLDDAVKIAGLFFKTGAVVKQSAKAGKEMLLADEDNDVDFAGPLVVLTSRISASASEIVAGTLQDYKRAVIVGADHTFGKGSVQSVIPLPSGLGASKVTVGMFYTPGGNSTQHRGVDADIVLPGALSTDEIGEKTLDYSLPPTTLAPFLSKSAYVKSGDDKWTPVTDSELSKLKSLSKIRVARSDDFKKIREDIAKAKKKDRVVDVAEILKERTESEKKEKEVHKDALGNRDKDEKVAEYLKRADVQEAIDIAVDLSAMRKGIAVTLGAKIEKKKGEQAHQ